MEHMSPRMTVAYADEATIVTFTDDRILEEKDVRELEQALASLIGQAEGISLVLDFSNVKFMSSAVLGLLIKVSKRVYEHDGRLALCAIGPKIYEIFKITRLTKIFDIYKNADAAIRRLAEPEQ
jgi:anti-sigma B factor antagonist